MEIHLELTRLVSKTEEERYGGWVHGATYSGVLIELDRQRKPLLNAKLSVPN